MTLLREAYDLDQGIYDEQGKRENPFALVSIHPFTRAANDGLYVMYMRRYRHAKVLKYHGLNFSQFMSLPSDIATLLLKDCDEALREETAHLTDTVNDLKDLEDQK